jgi:hypothetical protein
MAYEIVDCRLSHLRAIAGQLRPDDRAEALSSGLPVRRLLFMLWNDSCIRRAALVDGELTAVWGFCSQFASGVARPWLFTAPPIERVPLVFFRVAREQVAEVLETKSVLETGVLADYTRSLRFWKMIGFAESGSYWQGGQRFVKLRLERR